MKHFFYLLLFFLLTACSASRSSDVVPMGDTLALKYASLLSIVETDSFTLVEIKDAWHEGQVLHRYVLVSHSSDIPHSLPEGTLVRIPLQRATVFTSVHAALLNELGQTERIVGMCDMEFVVDSTLRNRLEKFGVSSMGSSMQPKVEAIVKSKSDALLVSPFKDNSYGPLEKLGVPIIECADYMETSALGRAEWMRFFGRLFGCKELADSAFARIETNYNILKEKVQKSKHAPRLVVDKRESGTWYVPGGKSTLSQVFKDAGMAYIFTNNKESGSVAMSFEDVVKQGAEADVWLIKYGGQADVTLKSLAADEPRYTRFKAWKSGNVYGCNTFRTPYYEKAPFHPDWLLEDLIRISHPECLPEKIISTQRFYEKLVP